jgi:hypothetical protein
MKKPIPHSLCAFACVLFSLLVPAALSAAPPQDGKSLILRKASAPIAIDGYIDPLWSEADSVSDFVQHEPYHGKLPSMKTVAKVLTTDHALYCIMLCYDDPKKIQRTKGLLDQGGGDIVSLMLDTFDDRRTAYKFAVTASGVRADCRLLDDARNRDYNWDGVWFSAAKIHSWGFVVEMEIPYRTIQYHERLTEWGLDFDRWNPERTEDIYWCAYEENEGQRISKFGRLMFQDFYPSVKGLNLEIYPVGIAKSTYTGDSNYDFDPNAGLDVFYNPSQRLTFQLTANPDFAQIEADPFSFNISRYESYFEERRPFFTEGNEVFMPSGKERSSGFYSPLELFYSRRIGKKLSDGTEVPLDLGTRAFGRVGKWEYGGFLAATAKTDYLAEGTPVTEPQALFSSLRFKRQILNNSSVGLLYVGKNTEDYQTGVVDIDGAFRSTNTQLAYQLAGSYMNEEGDLASSAGFKMSTQKWLLAVRSKYIGQNFDVNQVGFVPWRGTAELTAIGGPVRYFDTGAIREVLVYFGGSANYEKVDAYTDQSAIIGINMQFRRNVGYEISVSGGRAKDQDRLYDSWEVDYSGWCGYSPKWDANLYGGVSKTYNFRRDYLGLFSWTGAEFEWRALPELELGASAEAYVEWNPSNDLEDITFNSRPYFSLTPVNNLNIRMYLDNVWVHSTGQVEQIIGGLLFSYNFRPKSWIYFAVNELRDRSEEFDEFDNPVPPTLHVAARAAVFKVKYLFYF